jgi:hypothetical protein
LVKLSQVQGVSAVALAPTATEISVRQVLTELETTFASVARAVENGEFALWVGSGISRQAPDLGDLIERAFDFIRERAIDVGTSANYLPALEEALQLAEVDPASVADRYGKPLANWAEHKAIIDKLWNEYSRVLDIRIPGEPADFVLWDAIDIRRAFEHPEPPAATHLCIAILVLEGVVQAIASANWDGFIETAVDRLTGGLAGTLQVVVDPDQLRTPPGRARLLKFHGCIVHATREPAVFRRFLTGSRTQIMDWPETGAFAAMRNAIVGLATTQKTLVLGLSIQDNNLQTVFARAREIHAWPWPPAPEAPGHVFCEDRIQQGQRDLLRLAYGAAYDADPPAVHQGTLLRAWGEQVLIALVLRVVTDKLVGLMNVGLGQQGKPAIAAALAPILMELRDSIADGAVGNRTALVNSSIAVWSRALSLFRRGALPQNAGGYEVLSMSTPSLIAADQNAQALALDRFALALALLQQGKTAGHWQLSAPTSAALGAGAMTVRPNRPGGLDRPLFVVRSATEAIALQSNGAFANDNAVVIHGDDVWRRMISGGGTARRVRGAPGRTGRIGETHVSLQDILSQSDDSDALQRRFLAEMML